jgi:CRP-like cAMP-binding protein
MAGGRKVADQHPNGLIASLPAAEFDFIRSHLKTADWPQGIVLMEAGETIERVYFPHEGIVSVVVGLAGGETVEAAMVGRDSIVGGSASLDGKVALNKAIVQIGGSGSSLEIGHLRSLANASVEFRTALIRHDQMILVQAQQSAACNVSHTVEARLARWLLRSRDLISSDKLALTQEFLGQMLGVRRSSVSIVAGTLQRAGLIRYARGHIQIEDVDGLMDAASECYETVRAHSDRLLGPTGKATYA